MGARNDWPLRMAKFESQQHGFVAKLCSKIVYRGHLLVIFSFSSQYSRVSGPIERACRTVLLSDFLASLPSDVEYTISDTSMSHTGRGSNSTQC